MILVMPLERALAIASPPGRKATDLLHIVNRSVARLDGLRKRREVTLRYAQLSVAYCEPSFSLVAAVRTAGVILQFLTSLSGRLRRDTRCILAVAGRVREVVAH